MEEKIKGGTVVGVWDEPKKAEKPKEEKAEQPKETKKKTK